MKLKLLNHRYTVCLLAVLLAAVFSRPVYAGQTQISAKLDATVIEMGSKTMLRIQVVSDRGKHGFFPLFSEATGKEYATLLGDTIELSTDFKQSSVDLGAGRIQTDYQIPVQVFDSGFYRLPPLAYVTGTDTILSNSVQLKVVPVAVTAQSQPAEYTAPSEPADIPAIEKIKEWLAIYWWIPSLVVLLLLLALAGLYLWKNRKKLTARPKPLLPPYKEAMQALEDLKSKELWQKGLEKEYFTQLVDILRRYIARRFEIPAMEMTSDQIRQTVRNHPRLSQFREQFSAVLTVADMAKFANMRLTADENVGAFKEVVNFVEATKPTAEEEKADKERELAEIANPKPKGKVRSSAKTRSAQKSFKHSSGKKKKGGKR